MTVEAAATRPRASAMFPIVPAHLSRAPPPHPPPVALPPAAPARGDALQEDGDSDGEGGAYADDFLPAGATSAPLAACDFRVPVHDWDRSSSPVRLRVDGAGALACATSEAEGWVRLLPLARDPPSAALRLEVRPGEGTAQLAVRCIRDVPRGHALRLWFCDALLAPLHLPFLAPANIRGEKQYVCVSCGRQFEQPNPLKVHLALRCGRLPKQTLWERLEALAERLASPAPIPAPVSASTFSFRLHRSAAPAPVTAPASSAAPATSPPSSPALVPILPAPAATSRGSAFQPWTKSRSKLNDTPGVNAATASLRLGVDPSSVFLRSLLCPSAYSLLQPGSALGPLRLPPAPPLAAAVTAPAAPGPPPPSLAGLDTKMAAYPTHPSEMETLVSNIGSSKHGHLCIYCGKVYSRKYGLKIHIRTHTGYKPLKCKYCLRPFGDPSNLNKHIRLHAEGETPYKCEFCGKVLVRRRDLDRHIRSRHSLNGGDEDTDEASNLSDEQQDTGSEST